MAGGETGISVAQEGIPIDRAADYQKVLDSRWRFVEVELEIPFSMVIPAQTNGGSPFNSDTLISQHSLGFLPAFEAPFTAPGYSVPSRGLVVYSDNRSIFMRQRVFTGVNPAYEVTGTLRVYNVPIIEEYQADKELVSPSSGTIQNIGFRALDGSTPNLGHDSKSPVGYSIDTMKKILSIHKTGLADINSWIRRTGSVTAIDTATDILTMADRAGSEAVSTWITGVGLAMAYFPGDFTTYPAPLTGAGTYYTIPIDATHIKLAATYADALIGNAIDLTTAGALPGFLNGTAFPDSNEDKIIHNVGYPPTYLLAPLTVSGTSYIIEPLLDLLTARVKATATTLAFKGVQAVFGGRYGYMVLKDPAELVL